MSDISDTNHITKKYMKPYTTESLEACIWTPFYWTTSLMVPLIFSQIIKNDNHIHSLFGLLLGLSSVGWGQLVTIGYHFLYNEIEWSKDHENAVKTYFSQPEGFLLLGGYLSIYWIAGYMPVSYYSFSGGIQWNHVIYQLLLQDALQYGMHRIEHLVPFLYKFCHKLHHTHKEPKILDAFDGTIADTTCMVLIPLCITTICIHTNVWSYMVFGTLYANMLTLIHSEYKHPWDPYARLIWIGTADDHRVNHKLYKYNYGHIFTIWDWTCHTIMELS